MTLQDLLTQIDQKPNSVEFNNVIAVIESNYTYTPAAFQNGNVHNAKGSNEGSCKIFAFAKLNGLSAEKTLALFGAFYRNDVLGNPQGSDHANIRNFMASGWKGIEFESEALTPI